MLLQLSGNSMHLQVLKAMKESDSPRPAVFAMSNPTTKGLCADTYIYTLW
jgi:malate dehydrogenase (decarboxylating)